LGQEWKIIGASVQGTIHKRSGVPCQDAHAYKILSDSTIIIVVADGAGSADQSAEGASCAVKHGLSSIEQHLRPLLKSNDPSKSQSISEEVCRSIMNEAFNDAHQAILELARSKKISPRDLASTLIAAFTFENCLVSAQIGDGAAVAQSIDGHFFATIQPQRGEYANETNFLSAENPLDYLEVNVSQQPIKSLVVMTDGVTRLAIHLGQNKPHAGFFRPLVGFLTQVENTKKGCKELKNFLNSNRVRTHTYHDRTLVVAVSPVKAGS